jgi:hypothetical protein
MPPSRKFEYEKLHCSGHMLSDVLMYRQGLLSLESGGSGDHGTQNEAIGDASSGGGDGTRSAYDENGQEISDSGYHCEVNIFTGAGGCVGAPG